MILEAGATLEVGDKALVVIREYDAPAVEADHSVAASLAASAG
jgi:hypothetical protein